MRVFVLAIFAACDATWRERIARIFGTKKEMTATTKEKQIAQAMTCALAEPAVAVIA